jgi:apolipoprotein N-acyltransferase
MIKIGLLIVLPIGLSLILLRKSLNHKSEARSVEIAVVQPNFEPHYQKFNVSGEDQLQRFLLLSDSIVTNNTDYLVFPETSFSYVMINQIRQNRTIRQLQNFVDSYPSLNLVTGLATYRVFQNSDDLPHTIRKRNDGLIYDVQNSAIEITSHDPGIEVYFKSKLVPGAEFFPFKKILPFIEPIVRQLGGSMGHAKQPERSVFESGAGIVAPVICYESIYGAYVGEYIQKGANVIFIITNDGWWDDTPGHRQHLAFASLRAIEHRRPIARSANTGVSAFITPEGKILSATQYEQTTAIRNKVTPRNDVTFYTKWGDYLARVAVGIAALFIVFVFSAIWKRKVKMVE